MSMMKRTFTYLLTLMMYTVTIVTTVINTVGWHVAVSDWSEFRIRSWILIRHIGFYSKCVKICRLLVVFTRVGSVNGSPAIRGDNGYLEVRTVSSVVELYWPGIADRVMWQLTEARISSSRLNICWRRVWAKLEAQEKWNHLNAFDDKLFEAWVGLHHCLVSPRTVNTASWTIIHFL